MKEHKIDQLFRQKLQQHSVAPTPAAWDKVAAGLNHRRRKRGGYFAAAAVMALLLSAGWFWLQQNGAADYGQQPSVAVTEQAAPGKQPDAGREATALKETASVADNSTEVPAAFEGAAIANVEAEAPAASIPGTASKKIAPQPAISTTSQIAAEQEDSAQPAATASAQTDAIPETALAQALPEAPDSQTAGLELQPELIAIPAAELALAKSEQVIIKFEGSDSATPEDKPDSAPEKVLSLLQKVKHGDIGLADIRNAKDNIFSGRFNKP
ncbi:hypothetical protein D770_24220 [Flammeovirgaceae bacterium 311]|nr:hypothetical protein D770_24220 [Flammeovirgaceae bacterium 311]